MLLQRKREQTNDSGYVVVNMIGIIFLNYKAAEVYPRLL